MVAANWESRLCRQNSYASYVFLDEIDDDIADPNTKAGIEPEPKSGVNPPHPASPDQANLPTIAVADDLV